MMVVNMWLVLPVLPFNMSSIIVDMISIIIGEAWSLLTWPLIRFWLMGASGGHLIGKIVEVNFISSRILLLNDLNSRIPVVLSPSGAQAILSGAGRKNPVLEYLPEKFEISEESIAYTSGKDGVLLSGISIGKLIKKDDRIEVKLFADPNQIFLVNIILEESLDTEAM